jgi:hypothetical protein
MMQSGPMVAVAAIVAPGAMTAVGWMPGCGAGQSVRSIRAQRRAKATDGFSTRMNS